MPNARTIGIVDDDEALRDSLAMVLRFRNYDVLEFDSGESLITRDPAPHMDCMILDLRMKGKSGLEVMASCRARGMTMPIVMVTAFGDVSSATRALKSGAFDFLEKPVHEPQMLKVIEDALSQFDRDAALQAERQHLEERVAALTGRERQVLDAVLEGNHNREIAAALGLSVRTVEVYKARVMEKMRVSRLAELIKLFARLEAL
jgi:two-component system response regulator FixJ